MPITSSASQTYFRRARNRSAHTTIYIYIYIYTYIHTPIHIYIYIMSRCRSPAPYHRCHPPARPYVRGWRNTVKLILFKISKSMNPYPSIVHAYTNNMSPVIGCCWAKPTRLSEVSKRIPTNISVRLRASEGTWFGAPRSQATSSARLSRTRAQLKRGGGRVMLTEILLQTRLGAAGLSTASWVPAMGA